jgi:hypothetical protein
LTCEGFCCIITSNTSIPNRVTRWTDVHIITRLCRLAGSLVGVSAKFAQAWSRLALWRNDKMTEEPTFADLASDGIPFHFIPPFGLSGIPIPLDIFDALVNRYLSGPVRNWVDFDREEVTLGSVRYDLRQLELGELGTIELFKTGVQESSMFVKSPPFPAIVPPKADKEERPTTDVMRQMWDERDALDRKRKEHQASVIQTLFNFLAKDRAWQKHWREARDRWTKQRELKHLMSGAEALQSSEEFDACVQSIAEEISRIQSEDKFIINILKPLFDALGYEGVTVLHHTGTPERGKDIVFYERDRLGGFTFYAVVACAGKVHAKSSKAQTRDSGHYDKILDQIKKCFDLPYSDPNLKGDFYVDKVIVACSDSITDPALQLFRAWEDRERRRLIFLDSLGIAGHKLRLQRQDSLRKPAQ